MVVHNLVCRDSFPPLDALVHLEIYADPLLKDHVPGITLIFQMPCTVFLSTCNFWEGISSAQFDYTAGSGVPSR